MEESVEENSENNMYDQIYNFIDKIKKKSLKLNLLKIKPMIEGKKAFIKNENKFLLNNLNHT